MSDYGETLATGTGATFCSGCGKPSTSFRIVNGAWYCTRCLPEDDELTTLRAENERLRRIEAAAKVLRQDAGAANVVLVESQNVTAAFGVLNLALTQYDAALAAGKGE